MGDGVESFRLAAERALRDQRVQFEIKQREEDLTRLQNENKEMKAKLKEMIATMDANIEDRERVILYKVKRIDELQEKVTRLEADEAMRIEETVRGFTEQLSAVTQERDALRTKCDLYEASSQEIEEFKAIKSRLEAEMERLVTENKRLEASCAARLHDLETKHLIDMQRMKREREEEVARTRGDMERMMIESLDGTTRRAVEENAALTLELRYQSSKLEKILEQNEALKRDKTESRNNTDILTEMTEMLSKKVKLYEKLFLKMQKRDRAALEKQLEQGRNRASEKHDNAMRLFHSPPQESNPAPPPKSPIETQWHKAFEDHLAERSKVKRGVDAVLQYNQFIQGKQSPSPRSGFPRRGRRAMPVDYTPQEIQAIRLPHIVDSIEPKSYVSKAEYLDSTSPSPRPREGWQTART
ncbi:hypothetical protein LEN26_017862 [Aphanomyces euteiches]|nr:hypothetical protein LEN26_017862 [Aphanomyces euteiches]KAH9102397.1 hypothetical protein AeMF1_021005 [Aphanomyces euteiches]KAH9185210.1 hypothetical protein AeNC1_012816 [Aphanomyces euteiches]